MYMSLLNYAELNDLRIKELDLRSADGRICGNRIAIKKDLSEEEKTCVLAEELGHYFTTSGNILDQSYNKVLNRRQELRARRWAYDKLLSAEAIVNAYNEGNRTIWDMAEALHVPPCFLADAIKDLRIRNLLK